MSRYRKFGMLVTLALVLLSQEAYGYIDPGTTSAIFGILAPVLAVLLVFLGFLLRPFRVFFKFIIDKIRGGPEPEDDENLV